LNWALALLTAVLLILSVPRFDIAVLAAGALAPLLAAVARERSWKRRFLTGWLSGLVYWFGVCYWIQAVLEQYGGLGVGGAWGSFLLFCVLKGLHTAVFSALAGAAIHGWYAIPAVAALWTGLERTHGPFGFTWFLLGNAGIDMSVPMRLAPLIGVYGISFVFAMLSVGIALLFLRRERKHLLWLLVLPLLYLLPKLPDAERPRQTAVAVQPNVAEETEWTPALADRLQRRLVSLSLAGASEISPQLIVWPEMPAPVYYYEDEALRSRLATLAGTTGTHILAGTVAHTTAGLVTNSAVMVAPDGQLVDRYDKVYLVPFGEYVPDLFGWVNQITTQAGEFQPGSRVVVFPAGERRLGAFICYESVFPHFVRQFAAQGAGVLINLSNDGYFARSAAREQHLKIVRMRAAENRRWIVRATNDGITATVDPAGRLVQRLEPYVETSAALGFSFENAVTPYSRTGDWFAWLCLAGGLAPAVYRVARLRRRQPALPSAKRRD
jgi:apolipoprotein N-acyltransferase